MFDYDYLVIGSGFGGASSALRLAEKGWKVGVVEQGRRIGPNEIKQGKNKLSKLMWNPTLGMKGYFSQRIFKHMAIVGGVGVGGGSIVWASVMLPPKKSFYDDPRLKHLHLDLEVELAPHLITAAKMLGVSTNPKRSLQDKYLQQTAEEMNAGSTFSSVPNAIYFGEPGKRHPDPYFGGAGPEREGCTFCAGCLTGCATDSKNSLYLNYLFLAEKLGTDILPERKADRIEPLPEGGYRVSLIDSFTGKPITQVSAKNVVLSAGVIGTLELLFKNRELYKTLPCISQTLGNVVRTNSEAITAVLHPRGCDISNGTTISTDFYPDKNTHATQNRVDKGYRFIRYYYGPLVGGHRPVLRALKTLFTLLTSPLLMAQNLFGKDWHKRVSLFTVMQDLDNHLQLAYERPWWSLSKRLVSKQNPGHEPPSFLPIANKLTAIFAKVSGGKPMNGLLESIGGVSTTAHVLSGCPMGESQHDGVINTAHEVHGYSGLFVVDGSSIPGNIGVNPSLTITAMGERFSAMQPEKSDKHTPTPMSCAES